MASKKKSPADVLKLVIEALDPLGPTEKQWVLQSAASLWTVTLAAPAASAAIALGTSSGAAKPAPVTQQDAKTFLKTKDPPTETQRVACLGYYLANFRDTHAFKAADIKKLNTEAKGPNFNVPRAVGNAANSKHGYLSSVGKGQKQLTTHGEEIVEALPNGDRVKEIEAQRKKPKRGRRKKTKSV